MHIWPRQGQYLFIFLEVFVLGFPHLSTIPVGYHEVHDAVVNLFSEREFLSSFRRVVMEEYSALVILLVKWSNSLHVNLKDSEDLGNLIVTSYFNVRKDLLHPVSKSVKALSKLFSYSIYDYANTMSYRELSSGPCHAG